MSKHLFGIVVTPYGAAANNRGENEGNITTLQKLLWKGEVHTTVSAEAIRWAYRYFWQKKGLPVNRKWNEDKADHEWQDKTWSPWTDPDASGKDMPTFIDDDVLGFMLAEGAKTDGSDSTDALKKDLKSTEEQLKSMSKEDKKGEAGKALEAKAKELKATIKALSKGVCDKRRGPLEISRAISLVPFAGDITFNAKSGEKTNVSLYGTEVHATRYQYGFAITPENLREKARALDVVDAVASLSEVAGNQSRFLFDFSPETIIFRWTDDFAPRFLYGFSELDGMVSITDVISKIKSKDIDAVELFIGGPVVDSLSEGDKKELEKAACFTGVKQATEALKARISADLGL